MTGRTQTVVKSIITCKQGFLRNEIILADRQLIKVIRPKEYAKAGQNEKGLLHRTGCVA